MSKVLLQVKVHEARHLKKMDVFGKSDPYIVLNCDGRIRQTDVVKKNLNPSWNQTFEFEFDKKHIKNPPDLEVSCFDKETIGKDKEIGTFKVPLKGMFKSDKYDEWFELKDKKGKETGEVHLEIWSKDH
eukprot:TRINITY_DN6614_c0_g1_i2.p1 TRINITY_DN6614_c0_g1~~TRINITY_DN6614_c0_g1_i2.p1  ORF type:complete len:129 (-),score=26.44 TRINITY_DN6614_c0_g1_i2:26-412(-)